MRRRRLITEIEVPAPPDQVFPFFANPQNLGLLTPRDLGFEITTPQPIEMRAGLRIDYRVRILRVPMAWTSEITLWDPPHRFVDEQLRGPYRSWRHLHEFEGTRRGTRITDIVDYSVPGWIFEGLLHRLLVWPNLERIFRYRLEQIAALFDVIGEPRPPAGFPTGLPPRHPGHSHRPQPLPTDPERS